MIKAAKVSEEDMAAVQAECERRLGAAERKVYALVKERDVLRRGSDKLSSAHDLLKEKDSIIAQVCSAPVASNCSRRRTASLHRSDQLLLHCTSALTLFVHISCQWHDTTASFSSARLALGCVYFPLWMKGLSMCKVAES